MWCRVSDRVVSQCGAEFLIELFHSVVQSF